jgi:hypothetical protein
MPQTHSQKDIGAPYPSAVIDSFALVGSEIR